MTENSNRPMGPAAGGIERELAEATEGARRSLRTRVAIGVALVLVLTAWGTWLHAQVRSFEAADAAVLVRVEAASALPRVRAELGDRLRKAAPDLVARAAASLLQAPAYLRARLEPAIAAEIPQMAERLKTELAGEIRRSVQTARAGLDERLPEMSDPERFDLLAEEFVRGYRDRLRQVTQAYGAPYRSSLEGLRKHLEQLADTGGKDEKERLEREILVTFLELHARAKERGEIDVYSKGAIRLPSPRDD